MQKEQLSKFQGKINSAVIGYLHLLKQKELLSVSMNLGNALETLDNPIKRSILSIQDTLHAFLIVEVHSWLFDESKNSSNLSLHKLLNLLVNFESENSLKHLKKSFIKAPSVIHLGGDMINWQASFETVRASKFKPIIDECSKSIEYLLESEEMERIKKIRDKVIAHKDGQYDITENQHKIGDIFFTLEQMKQILLSLIELFLRVSYPIEDEERKAKSDAEKFWSHVALI